MRFVERAHLDTEPPVTVVVATTPGGDGYQLVTASATRGPLIELATEPDLADALVEFMQAGGRAGGPEAATVTGHWRNGATRSGPAPARSLGAEQSNTSVVVGGTHVLKVLRRLRPGPHPEVEVGLHLARVADSAPAPVPALSGWYELVEPDGTSTTLGIVQELVPGALDGWALVLGGLAADPGELSARLHDLGVAVAELHGALRLSPQGPGNDSQMPSSDGDDHDPAAFGAESLRAAMLTDLSARIDLDAERSGLAGDGRISTVVSELITDIGEDTGVAMRTHGDLHLGQTLLGSNGWMILDFEGEPSRPVTERRLRLSPLRDIAGMLRSFAYAAATHNRTGGTTLARGWEKAARAAFLDGYLASVDPTLLPTSAVSTQRLITLFEVEKLIYEIGYESAHRPDWIDIPMTGLQELVGSRP